MFDYDEMRAIISKHLSEAVNQSRALDTAIMAACRVAYQRGGDDRVQELYHEMSVDDRGDPE